MLSQALLFLLDAITGFLTVVLLLRFYMQAFRVSFGNQVGTFVVECTNWLVRPLRKVLPGLLGLDLASLLPAYLLQILFLSVAVLLNGSDAWLTHNLWLFLLWRGAMGLLRLSVYLLIAALILQAILSWVSPYSPLSQPLIQLTRPFLRPIQRFLPPIGSVDLSPLVVIVLAQLVLIFL